MVCRVEIEEVTADENVIGVRRLEDRETAGTQHAHHFVQQREQHVDWHVLDNVKARDGGDASVRQAAQVDERIVLDDVEPALAAFLDRDEVLFDAARRDGGFFVSTRNAPGASSASPRIVCLTTRSSSE